MSTDEVKANTEKVIIKDFRASSSGCDALCLQTMLCEANGKLHVACEAGRETHSVGGRRGQGVSV